MKATHLKKIIWIFLDRHFCSLKCQTMFIRSHLHCILKMITMLFFYLCTNSENSTFAVCGMHFKLIGILLSCQPLQRMEIVSIFKICMLKMNSYHKIRQIFWAYLSFLWKIFNFHSCACVWSLTYFKNSVKHFRIGSDA